MHAYIRVSLYRLLFSWSGGCSCHDSRVQLQPQYPGSRAGGDQEHDQVLHSVRMVPNYFLFPLFPFLHFPPSAALCRILNSCIFQPCIFVPHFPVSHFPPPSGLCRIFQSCIFMSRIFSAPHTIMKQTTKLNHQQDSACSRVL